MILVLGSKGVDTAQYYKSLDIDPSILITSAQDTYKVGHTSPQDAGNFENLTQIAKKADHVYFTSPCSSQFASLTYYQEYLDWLKKFHYEYGTVRNFPNFDLDAFDFKLSIDYKTNPDDIVFFGCSVTQGTGLQFEEQTYAYLIAKHFGQKCVNLASKGSSNDLIFEKFSRYNFHKNQMVIVQLTSLFRKRHCNENGVFSDILFSNPPYQKELLDVYNEKFLFYELLVKLNFVLQIAKAKNLKLVFWLINYKQDTGGYTKEQQNYFYNCKQFVPAFLLENYMIDIGTDKVHPGPESNKKIAEVLINFITKTYT